MEQLNAELTLDPFDYNLWCQLLSEAQAAANEDLIRSTYERVLAVFPNSVQHWLEYIDFELKNNQLTKAEALFTRCTTSLCSLAIFKLYLQYIRRANSTREGVPKGPTGRKIIIQAFEFVLHRAGYDREAGPVWLEYIALLKTNESHNSWEQQQSIEKIRRVYHQAVSIPTLSLDQIWKEYELFENSLNRVAAKKILSERSSIYNNSKAVLKDLKNFTDQLKLSLKTPTRPPMWSPNDIKLAELWRNYIIWEKTNPLGYELVDMVRARLIFAYNQAIIAMRFYPEFWVDFATFYLRNNKKNEALAVFKAASKALPTSILINVTYAEFQEKQKRESEAHEIYRELINKLTKQLENIKESYEAKLKELNAPDKDDILLKSRTDGVEIDGETKEMLRRKEKVKEKQRLEIETLKDEDLDKIKRQITLVWIHYMKSARRSEGVKGLRKVFGEARKSGNVTYHLFVDSALMEYYHQDDPKIPENIFQYGQRFFAQEPGYISQYLDYLMKKKDTNNTRALFERSIENIPKDKALELWEKISSYEADCGDISNLEKIESRIFGSYSLISASSLYAERLSYLDINADSELGPLDKGMTSLKLVSNNPDEIASAIGASKKTLLDSVISEEFVRPDFSKWTSYKPNADGTRNPVTIASSSAMPAAQTVNQTNPIQATAPIPVPAPAPAPSATLEQIPPQAPAPLTNMMGAPQIPPQPPVMPQNPPLDLPPAVAYFLSQIPPPSDFMGPNIPVDRVINMIGEAVLNIPPAPDMPGNMNPNARMPPSFPNQMSRRPGPPGGFRPNQGFRNDHMKRMQPSPHTGFPMSSEDQNFHHMQKRNRQM